MADTPNDEAQPSASKSESAKKKVKKVAAKKKTTKVAANPAKKKAASKKVVAKKGTAKKKVSKKAATKTATASQIPTTTPSPAPRPPTPIPAAAPTTAAPQWDDDQGETGMIGMLVQWGPVLLLLLLMFVLGSNDEGDTQDGLGLGTTETKVSERVIADFSNDGAVTLSESFDPWVFDDSGNLGGDFSQGIGESVLPDTGWLEDPAAFYWGPAIVDEFPPAPE